MIVKISSAENQKLNELKELDVQQCDFCKNINLLNLGWEPFKEFYCLVCEEKHVLCLELCYKVALNIFECELYQEALPPRIPIRPVKPNRPYDRANCYLCGKELAGAGKTGKIKNRNNPSFWGVKSEWKILCLKCLGKRYLSKLSGSKRKTYWKYLKRGYE